jgi:hypothetical protein
MLVDQNNNKTSKMIEKEIIKIGIFYVELFF